MELRKITEKRDNFIMEQTGRGKTLLRRFIIALIIVVIVGIIVWKKL